MPSIGNTSKPTSSWHAWGSNTINQESNVLTMPERGKITRVGIWVGGWDNSFNCRVVIWRHSDGAVLGESASFTVANEGSANGSVVNYERDLVTPVELDEGVQFQAGFARAPTGRHQIATRSGNHRERFRSTWPGSMSGASSETGEIGAYVANYDQVRGAWVRRGGVWVRAEGVFVRRSGAWVDATSVQVRRSGAWVDAD